MIAWTEPDSDDAWLAMDRNGNGVIDDGTELFGNFTPIHPDLERRGIHAENGFEALKATEAPEWGRSRRDGIIDRQDAIWTRLRLWTDRNHNGYSEADELVPVARKQITAIETAYRLSRRRDEWGNEFRQRALMHTSARSGYARATFIYDVWLRVLGWNRGAVPSP
jgi:hypothetical protein